MALSRIQGAGKDADVGVSMAWHGGVWRGERTGRTRVREGGEWDSQEETLLWSHKKMVRHSNGTDYVCMLAWESKKRRKIKGGGGGENLQQQKKSSLLRLKKRMTHGMVDIKRHALLLIRPFPFFLFLISFSHLFSLFFSPLLLTHNSFHSSPCKNQHSLIPPFPLFKSHIFTYSQ